MAVLEILTAWVLFGTALCGIGLLAARVLRIRTDGSLSLSFWLGYAVTLGALCAVCLGHAIDGGVTIIFLCVGAAGFAAPNDRQQWWRQVRHESGWIAWLLLIAVWLADRARLEPQNGDSYLYHLQAVAWAESYRVTPGLANLHDRLGFNNSSTLLLALLDHGPLEGRAAHVANGLPLLPLFARGIRAVARLAGDIRRSARTGTPRDGLDAVLLVPAVDWALGINLSSASPDLPVACVEAAIASELAGCLSEGSRHPLSSLVLMAAGLLTLKLSSLGFLVGLAWPMAFLVRGRWGTERLRRAGIAAVSFVSCWIARGIVLSGYPFYPNGSGALPVDWRIRPERQKEEWGYMLAFGRRPGEPWREVLASWDWLGPWAKSIVLLNRDVVIPVVAAVVLVVVARVVPGRKAGVSRPLFVLFGPPLAGLAFWFATSPDVRFAGACFWLLPAAGAALFVSRGLRGPAASLLPGAALALALWPFTTPWRHIGPVKPGFRDPAPARTKSFVTRSGLSLLTPASGSGCYGSALLCAQKADQEIRLRDPNHVAAGFTVQP